MENKVMGSIAEMLLRFTSTTPTHDSNYEIAEILLANYDKLKELSITQVAELCFVSNASISRFCRFLGFENFKMFHQHLNNDFTMRIDYSQPFCAMLQGNPQMALAAYRDDLVGNIYATITPENMELIPIIAKTLHECSMAAFFSHHFLWDVGQHFQSKMIIMDKHVKAYLEYPHQLECARQLDANSLAIICSLGGSYMTRCSEICEVIRKSGCKLLIITQNLSAPYLNSADYILQCGQINRNDVGKYAALMAVDMLLMEYMKRYDKNGL